MTASVPPARGRPRRTATDAAINAATRRLLHEEGYAALTIEGVARRAGVGKPTVYRRHDSKASLVSAALREPLESVNPQAPDTGDVAADLRLVLENLGSVLASTDFGDALVEIMAPARRDPELDALFRVATSQRRIVIRSVMGRVADAGRLGPSDVETAIDMVLGAVYFRFLFTRQEIDEAFVGDLVASVVTRH